MLHIADHRLRDLARPATVADWVAIERLLRECDLPIAGARDHLASFLVFDRANELSGCAGLEHYGEIGLLRSVAIAPHMRRQGLAEALVRAQLAVAAARGMHSVYLLTTTAHDYFARLGFVDVPRDDAPQVLQGSAEFRGACPASATLMRFTL